MIGSSNDDNWFRNDNERADDTRINDDHSRARAKEKKANPITSLVEKHLNERQSKSCTNKTSIMTR